MYKIKPDSVLQLELPWPPTVNHYWGQRVAKGRITKFIGDKGVKFRKDVIEGVKPHLDHCEKHYGLGARLSMCVLISPPDRRRRDIDNLSKALLDALEHAGAYPDDEQIDSLMLIRNKDAIVKDGKIVVILGTCDGLAEIV